MWEANISKNYLKTFISFLPFEGSLQKIEFD